MGPASLTAPEIPKMIAHGIVQGFGKSFVFVLTTTKLVVAHGNLPHMSIDRYCLAPTQAHETDAVGNLGAYATKLEELFMGILVSGLVAFFLDNGSRGAPGDGCGIP